MNQFLRPVWPPISQVVLSRWSAWRCRVAHICGGYCPWRRRRVTGGCLATDWLQEAVRLSGAGAGGKVVRQGVALLLAVCLSGCVSSSSAPIRKLSEDGAALTATVTATDEAITISYAVTNEGQEPLIITNGVPGKDTTNLPAPDPEAVYVSIRPGKVLEVSRRSFDPKLGANGPPYLLLGTQLAGGETLRERIQLTGPLETYQPGRAAKAVDADAWSAVVFCVGVTSASRIDADLQLNASAENPVVHHGITQNVLCTEPIAK